MARCKLQLLVFGIRYYGVNTSVKIFNNNQKGKKNNLIYIDKSTGGKVQSVESTWHL